MIARTARQFPLIVALVLAIALVPAALAAKGGGGKPGGGGTTTGATLTGYFTGTTYGVNGKGFQPGQLVALSIGEAGGCCSATNRVADASGNLSYESNLVGPGTYTVRASVLSGSRWTIVASWSGTSS